MGGLVKNTRREVERELSAVLHRHAEDAMKHTDTMVEHQKLEWIVADQTRTDHRRRWILGGVAAAVAAVAVGIAVSSSDPSAGPSEPPIAQVPDSATTADLSVAESFAAAFVAHDVDAAESYLAPGMTQPWLGADRAWKRDAAYRVEYLMRPCTETGTSVDATIFTCPYAMHLLGSREVGKGPYRGNTLWVTVADGKVTSADTDMPFETNGMGDHFDAVHTWVANHHPQDYKHFLVKDEQNVGPVEWPRWTRLWQQYIREYVAATNQAR
jgi:hypothetical protein